MGEEKTLKAPVSAPKPQLAKPAAPAAARAAPAAEKAPEPAPQAEKADEEIDQILQEINDLQKDLVTSAAQSEAPATSATPAADEAPQQEESAEPAPEVGLNDFRGSSDDASMEEMLVDLKEDPEAAPNPNGALARVQMDEVEPETPPAPESKTEPKEVPMSVKKSSDEGSRSEGCLTMTLSGSMTLKLRYEFEGQEVVIGFKDDALYVQTTDGTEFKVPVRKKPRLKAIA